VTRPHILWVENQPEYSRSHQLALEEADRQVTMVRSAADAIDRLRERPSGYDLLILDVLMGSGRIEGREVIEGRTGLALYHAIREDLRINVPILFVTVLVNDQPLTDCVSRDRAHGHWARALHKPVTPSQLLRAVDELLTVAQTGAVK
jgi:CheY-like chemotaxis protein